MGERPGDHRPAVPAALEDLIAGLGELVHVFGEPARAVVPLVQAKLTEAMAARDRGDPVATMRAIGAAMEGLARLADRLDPPDAMRMRAIGEHFQTALLRGDLPQAKQGMDVMFERSGARQRKPPE
ncbi:MAG: hypothetical protein ACRERC_09970 [Candidatus Binatia bacterium]